MAARFVVLMLVVVAVLVPMRSAADVAGTGTFDIFVTPLPTPAFDGTLVFDNAMNSVLGESVNLALAVGDMTYDGDVTVNPAEQSATFTVGADADETDFSFVGAGSASCNGAGCLAGTGTFAGRLEITLDDANVLPDGVFTFDGTVQIDALGEGIGTFAINAFPLINTPAGTDVEATSGAQTFFDSVAATTRGFEARAIFANVTTAGTTSFAALSALSGTLPTGIVLDPAVSVFVDVQTTAGLAGGVQLCLGFVDANADGIVDGTAIAAAALRLLHAAAVGSAFVDVTAAPVAGMVCGAPSAPGPIVLAVGEGAGETTTTTVVTSESTTTSTAATGESTTTSTISTGESTTTTAVSGETTTTSIATPASTSTTSAPTPTSTSSTTSTTTTTVRRVIPATSTTVIRASTTSSTLPICATALACLDLTIAGPLCPGETLNQKLAALILKKLTKAQRALLKARTAGGGKAGKLVAKARKQLDSIGRRSDAFVSKKRNPISLACRDGIRTAVARVTAEIAAQRI